jgi:hypothetical protein
MESIQRRRSDEGGFSLVEVLAAMFLTLVVVGAAIGLANPHTLAARVQPDSVDAQQRLRTVVDVLSEELYDVGAGVDTGTLAGPLGRFLPPVIPRLMGLNRSDPPGLVRQDAMTLLRVPAAGAQSALSAPLVMPTARLLALPGCPATLPACGLTPGDGLVVFDDQGHFDVFSVISALGLDADLRHRGLQAAYGYAAGSQAAEAELRSYYFDAAQRQLRFSDGDATDQPVVDGLVRVAFEYFGSPAPPRLPKPAAGVANCLYDAAGVPDPTLITLPAGSDGLATLTLAMLGDGPWCGAGDTRFDRDLLRIRRVRVTAAAATSVPGRPVSITFDIAPRNLADQP